MSEPAIRVEGISKAYRIGQAAERYPTFREALVRGLAAPVRRLWGRNGSSHTPFWALRDVSFEVQPGEVIGIIGRNGAGKSTLLKILSRITEPTSGRAILNGRVASLLEVGTGFHPELTGRENVYLNGAILGMKRAEIARKFKEIVAFAEIEEFLDTPVKHYSSGMYVRLAFAVAAHLEPEILIVDEVLAVGDAEFQKKCLGKMQEVSRGQGRTVLFVSHNLAAVQHLCPKAALLYQGQLVRFGDTAGTIAAYLGDRSARCGQRLAERNDRQGNGTLRFTDVQVHADGKSNVNRIRSGSSIEIEMQFAAQHQVRRPVFYAGIFDIHGVQLLTMNTRIHRLSIVCPEGCGHATCRIDRLPLTPGKYLLNIAVVDADGSLLDRVEAVRAILVESGDYFGTGEPSSSVGGQLLIDHTWQVSSDNASTGAAEN
jgi:lipopolysaccharide transport system ATP-binding protein